MGTDKRTGSFLGELKMGTTTIYTRFNDLKFPLNKMTKKELKELSELSPYREKNLLFNQFCSCFEVSYPDLSSPL